MLLPLHSEHLRTAPPVGGTGHRSSQPEEHPVRTLDCVTAVLLFLAAVMVALLAFSTDWTFSTADHRPQAYENTPVLVIPPHPR
ncbi:hypothetical protein TSH100_23855 [Azospirillum sp. TSH100]|uniref:hypothetical protein n=1 Tax=Azospirillum sp. TSH100 TaxID=652764 RepID=UPI000D61AA82|nr:hypothetical protein [Azospirillum sp. TSH100]PWC82408.1 hypothetical protein TSH100_23855 [Azospirillum sp. TSH100]QCG87970.1 hypothetical protein E6C72_09710 [Azospirillum sp. TSH100]